MWSALKLIQLQKVGFSYWSAFFSYLHWGASEKPDLSNSKKEKEERGWRKKKLDLFSISILEFEFGQRAHHCTKHRQYDYDWDECVDGRDNAVRVNCCGCHIFRDLL